MTPVRKTAADGPCRGLDLFPAFAQGCLGTQDQPGLRTVLSAIDEGERGRMKSGRFFFYLSMTCFSSGMRPASRWYAWRDFVASG